MINKNIISNKFDLNWSTMFSYRNDAQQNDAWQNDTEWIDTRET